MKRRFSKILFVCFICLVNKNTQLLGQITPLPVSQAVYAHENQPDGELFKKVSYTIHFRVNQAIINQGYLSNGRTLQHIDSLMRRESADSIDSWFVKGYASPEGDVAYNEQLARRRADKVYQHMLTTYPQLAGKPIKVEGAGINWDELRKLTEADNELPDKDKVLNILNNSTLTSAQRTRQLRALPEYNYLYTRYYPKLRSGVSLFFLYTPAPIRKDTIPGAEAIGTEYPEPVRETSIPEAPPVAPAPLSAAESPPETPTVYRYIRPVAGKTNLLFDLVSALNVEVELPLGRRFSMAAEYIFPWWLWESRQHCFETITGGLEGRYWFKPDYRHQEPSLGRHNPLTGWFAGLYTNLGYYDLEWDANGYQGEFYIALGISAGYVKPLSRNLSLEFSLGVGFLNTRYRHYHAEKDAQGSWHLIRQNDGNYRWLGPTKAKVALIWYPHFKKKGGKGL